MIHTHEVIDDANNMFAIGEKVSILGHADSNVFVVTNGDTARMCFKGQLREIEKREKFVFNFDGLDPECLMSNPIEFTTSRGSHFKINKVKRKAPRSDEYWIYSRDLPDRYINTALFTVYKARDYTDETLRWRTQQANTEHQCTSNDLRDIAEIMDMIEYSIDTDEENK